MFAASSYQDAAVSVLEQAVLCDTFVKIQSTQEVELLGFS